MIIKPLTSLYSLLGVNGIEDMSLLGFPQFGPIFFFEKSFDVVSVVVFRSHE
jgi:hypothetical protein